MFSPDFDIYIYYLTDIMGSSFVFVPADSSCWVNGTLLIQKLQ